MANPSPIEPFDIAGFVADRASFRLRLQAGEKVFLKGDAADGSMFVVLSGLIDVIVLGKVLASVGRGGILGEMAMIDCTHRSAAALAQSIVALAQTMGLGVIAEGVETAEQREFLARVGCHAYQGYHFGRPVPLAEFEAQMQALRAAG